MRRVAVIGAGIGGIGMGIRLKAAGIPFTIFERGQRPGAHGAKTTTRA